MASELTQCCNRCHEYKPLKEFDRYRSGDPLKRCRNCDRIYQALRNKH